MQDESCVSESKYVSQVCVKKYTQKNIVHNIKGVP